MASGVYASWEIVGVHNMSKRTFLYGGYVKIDPDDNNLDDTTHFTAGMRHHF